MTVTIDDLVKIAIIIMAVWGFYKVVMEIIHAITARHDKEQKWDETPGEIVKRYDAKLEELEGRINDNHCDTEAKMQQIRAELQIQSETLLAVLDGLQQLNCNGAVSDAKKKLDAHLLERAYDK